MRNRAVVALISLAAVAVLPSAARADDDVDPALYSCHRVPATGRISVNFKPDASVLDLSAWLSGFTCKKVVFSTDVARRVHLNVIAPGSMTPKQAVTLFRDALDAAGLVVVERDDTFVVKAGPGMTSCPDGAGPAAPSPAPSPSGSLDAELDAGIHAIDATHVEITRALADKLLADPRTALRGARGMPMTRDGASPALKIYAIRPSSLLARLGILNGDVIVAIDGKPIPSVDQAAAVVSGGAPAHTITIDIMRRLAPVTLVITVVP
jgi:PDZ domain